MEIKNKLKGLKRKMARKMTSENGKVKPITEEGIKEMKEELENEGEEEDE